MNILIITPVYKAWDRVEQMCNAIDENTFHNFHHVLVTDSCTPPPELISNVSSSRREWQAFNDNLPEEEHRMCLTRALQTGWEWMSGSTFPPDYVFVVESDIMVPLEWDKDMIMLSQLLPKETPWLTLDAIPVDEKDEVTYPAAQHNVYVRHEAYSGKTFEVLKYSDWNAILFNPILIEKMREGLWRFDEVPSHHDILLSRKFRELFGYARELEPNDFVHPIFFRTTDVRTIHYPSSSRSQLPEGLNTPSNPK